MLPCGTPQLRVRADDSLPLTLHLWVRPLKYDENHLLHLLPLHRKKPGMERALLQLSALVIEL